MLFSGGSAVKTKKDEKKEKKTEKGSLQYCKIFFHLTFFDLSRRTTFLRYY